MKETQISFNSDMRELFEYDDPTFPLVVWTGDFSNFLNRSLAYHWHNEFEYCFVLSGSVGFTTEGHYIEVQQGEAIFINAKALHFAEQISRNNAKVFTVSFLPSLLTSGEVCAFYRKFFLPVLQLPVRSFLITDAQADGENILNYLKKVFDEYNEQNYDYELKCIGYISNVWRFTLSYLKGCNNTILQKATDYEVEQKGKMMLNYIHNHYDEDIRIDDIAQYIKTSRSSCFRCFRQYTNKTPIEYLTEYRLSRAIHLMAQSDKSMTQIASECGFSDSSYFGKKFLHKYKITPLQYKKGMLANETSDTPT